MRQILQHAFRFGRWHERVSTANIRETDTAARQHDHLLRHHKRISQDEMASQLLVWTAKQGEVGTRDLPTIKALCDEYADTNRLETIGRDELRDALIRLGIANGQRPMHPYERGYEIARRRSYPRRPMMEYFVLPRDYPFRKSVEPTAPLPEQTELFELDSPGATRTTRDPQQQA